MGRYQDVIRSVFLVVVCTFSSNLWAKEVDFGRVRIGSSQIDSVHLINDKLVSLMITNLTVSNPIFASPARAFTPGHVILDPGAKWSLPVLFKPSDTGFVKTQLQFETSQGDILWDLLGDGVQEVVVINEVLADPASGIQGDANADGMRQSNQDEFVELLNTGKYTLDIGGWELFDAGASASNRFRFPSPTFLEPNNYVVVFGGGNVSVADDNVFFDDGKIGGGLRNSGDEVLLFDPSTQETMARMSYGSEGGKNQSLVRSPEGVGPWTLHTTFPGKGSLQSPGKARTVAKGLDVSLKTTEISWGDTLSIDAKVNFQDDTNQVILPEALQVTFGVSGAFESVGAGNWVAKQTGVFTVVVRLSNLDPDTLTVVVDPPHVVEVVLQGVDSLMLVEDQSKLGVLGIDMQSQETILTENVQFAVGDTTMLQVEQATLRARASGRTHVSVAYEGLTSSQTVTVVNRGDLNQDGQYTLWDAVKLVNLILGKDLHPTEFEQRSADLNLDGHIDIRDLVAVIQNIVGGPVVSAKVGAPMGSLGWRMVAQGLILTVPTSTVVLTFEGETNPQKNDLRTDAGQIHVQKTKQGYSGIVLLGASTSESLSTQEILVRGIIEQKEMIWTAWTLGGGRHSLYEKVSVSGSLRLISGQPNPGNPYVTINYEVPVDQEVTIDIFRIDGQWVRHLIQQWTPRGKHQVVWDARDALGREVASGVYFANLKGAGAHSTLKLMVLR